MGILKHLLGGGHGSRHGYGSHGNRHGQNGSYGDPNLNPQPRQAALACGACGAAQAAGGRFCAQCGASLTPAACAQCRATLAPGASFCGQCGARAQA
ncbi:zinc ribbon domain-containing protein [Achromobacter sp. AONIH1]|uniref:double zinc ribbon domain-containing protein n=1 Tax=unclassified Achromobacter TaxID=2626865 RepID=UPI000CD084C4|nr:zinc ribbon domain-containing protein [Achromobacter sp. AONIH1]AUT47608.1 adenylate cyclase [Achromobacter sp. AONIH1]